MKNLSTNEKIGVAVGILVVGFFFIFGNILINIFNSGTFEGSMNTRQTTQTTSQATNTPPTTIDTSPATTGQLGIQDISVGTGAVAQPGDTVTVNYVGTFTDGTVFDSSIARKQPFSFVLGAGKVIPGWDQGVAGMKVGGTRVLVIPPELGYGSQDVGPIPAGSTLIFQIQLLKVTK